MAVIYHCYNYAGLFDTQSITWKSNSSSRLLCVTCSFAPWIKIQSKCFIRMQIQEAANSSSEIVHLNDVGMPKACFRNLPTDGLYIVKLSVSDDRQRKFFAVFNQLFINFTTTSPRKHLCVCMCLIFEKLFLFSEQW